jgi:hypothetical protein
MEINVIFIQNATAYSQAGKMLLFVWRDDNLVEIKIYRQIQPDDGLPLVNIA